MELKEGSLYEFKSNATCFIFKVIKYQQNDSYICKTILHDNIKYIGSICYISMIHQRFLREL